MKFVLAAWQRITPPTIEIGVALPLHPHVADKNYQRRRIGGLPHRNVFNSKNATLLV
jgi:hypothetical protein